MSHQYKREISRNGKKVYIDQDTDISSVFHHENAGSDLIIILSGDHPLITVQKECSFILERFEYMDCYVNIHYLIAEKNSESGTWTFKDYIKHIYSSDIEDVREFPTKKFLIEDCALRDKAFLIFDDKGTHIYNLRKLSKPFKRVFKDSRLGDNVVLVEEEVGAMVKDPLMTLRDSIIYGIDLETYDIVTPIWSQMQRRYIPLYTKERVEEINRQNESFPFGYAVDNCSLGEITIFYEVIGTLDELSSQISGLSEKEPATETFEQSFIEGFKKRK